MCSFNITCEDETVKCYKKVREPQNVKKELTCDKNRIDVMLVLFNITIEPSNLRKKKRKGTTICDKRTVTCDIGTAQCEDETVKCEKKVREPLNVTKKLSHVLLESHNVRMKSSNVRKKK